MENSDNNGKVTVTFTDMSSSPKTIERISIGGIAGAPSGNITKCNNYGEINVKFATKDGNESSVNYIGIVGGISGGDYFTAGQNSTNIKDCVNEGKITFHNDSNKANSAMGGIVGWPGLEKTSQTVVSENCTNNADITFKGKGKCRTGGIQGGSGNIKGCTNNGNILIEDGKDCAVGSVAGFHTQGHVIENCKAYGTVTAKVAVSGIGGLIGNIGNVAHTTGDGCVVDCTVTGGTAENAGMVVGLFNGDPKEGKPKKIELGATTAIKVAGTLNGVAVTSENLKDYLHGTKNYKADAHIINAVFGK